MFIHVDLPTNPTSTSQEKGINWRTRRVFTKDEILFQMNTYRYAIRDFMAKNKLSAPAFSGPVVMIQYFTFSSPKKKLWGTPKDTKPDTDNSSKLLSDVLEDMGFFEVGDQQVTHSLVIKEWGPAPSVEIFIDELKNAKCVSEAMAQVLINGGGGL